MIGVKFDSAMFAKEMEGLMEYSVGFLEGAKAGKNKLLEEIGKGVKEILAEFIDANARVSPNTMHHVYEWYQTGSPQARLFDIEYTVSSKNGLSLNSTFTQSLTVSKGSSTPFYNKANVMESGIGMVIRPRPGGVLVFEDNGEAVYTKKPVSVQNPGGAEVQGSFRKVFDLFFQSYFSQSFLYSSGLAKHLSTPSSYNQNISSAKTGGKRAGYRVGYRWISSGSVNI
jgi:hypothetical protein